MTDSFSKEDSEIEVLRQLLCREPYGAHSSGVTYPTQFLVYGSYRVLVVDIEGIFTENEMYDVAFDRIRVLRRLKSFINDSFIAAARMGTKINLIDNEDGSLSLVVQGDGTEELKKSIRIAEAICGYLASNERGISVIVGIGSKYTEPTDLWKSYDEAKKSIRICEKLWGRDRLVLFEELGIYRLISTIPSYTYLKDYCEATIIKLLEYEKSSDLELLKTLQTYLKCNENLKETANSLFIHPNTVKYRLKLIKKVTGLDPYITKDRLQLYMGLMILPLINPD